MPEEAQESLLVEPTVSLSTNQARWSVKQNKPLESII
jgi:hypothetical protein